MNSPQPKYEGWLYGLAFLIALALRFIQLGAAPLADSEAAFALQAFQLARGETITLAPQPVYILLTAVLFAVIEATNFMARALPALTGTLLVFVPILFKNKIGARPALLLAFLFAIDPSLTALSRQSNAAILAVTFLITAWGMWINRRAVHAGIFLALALLSGPSIWSGLLMLFLTRLFLRFTESNPPADTELPGPNKTADSPIVNRQSSIVNAFAITLLLAGTLFFTVPNGLSALFASIPAYFTGWVTPSTTTTTGRVLFTFLAYELLGISIAILALIRGFRTNSKRITRLSMWLGVALLLAIFYRNTNELVWAVIPLLTLAAMEISRAFDMEREEYLEVGVIVIGICLLSAYIWFNISGIALNPFETPATVPIFGVVEKPRAFVLYGSMGILAVSIGLVGFGWSARLARLSTTWSFAILFGLYSIAAAWGASGLRNPGGIELWLPDTRPVQADLLRATVEEVSEFSEGHDNAQSVTIFGVASPALEWALRNNNVTVVAALDPQATPPLVVTSQINDLALPSAYRGQDFIWRQNPQWATLQEYDWVKWLVFRQVPLDNEMIVLWVRDDLFPDARPSDP